MSDLVTNGELDAMLTRLPNKGLLTEPQPCCFLDGEHSIWMTVTG